MESKEQGKESSIEYQERTASARTRRGFLKHATAAGIAGMASITIATKAASAYSQTIKVLGKSGWSSYTIGATGDIDLLGASEGSPSNPGYDDDDGNVVHGKVKKGGVDRYDYSGAVDYVRINGHAQVYMPNSNNQYITVWGESGYTSYQLVDTIEISRVGGNEWNDYDKGEYINGKIRTDDKDSYHHDGNIRKVGIDGYATVAMHRCCI